MKVDKEMAKKVGAGLIIAVISWSGAWVVNSESKLAVAETRINNLHNMMIQEQSSTRKHEERITGIETHVVRLLEKSNATQEKQAMILSRQTEQMDNFKQALEMMRADMVILKEKK